MRKLTVLLAIIFIVMNYGCSPKLSPRIVNTYYADYSKYASEGFLITPDMYPGQFDACGEIFIEVYPADVVVNKNTTDNKFDVLYDKSTMRLIAKENISHSELIEMAVEQANKVGANALVNFKCHIIRNSVYSGGISSSIFSHYEISGFAIKRK